jgi:hypothetical protein
MNPGANLYELDWTPTPAHQVFVDKVFGEWWTDEVFTTGNDGTYTTSLAKGTYVVEYICIDIGARDTIVIGDDDVVFDLGCGVFVDTEEVPDYEALSLYPNPTTGSFSIETALRGEFSLRNMLGQEVFSGRIDGPSLQLSPKLTAGNYILEIYGVDGRRAARILVVE